jgi:SAM-dependent methyltransferase
MDKAYYKQYYYLEREHWWFRARLEILENLFKKDILPKATSSSKMAILNAGVATGATTTMLEQYGEVTSLEYDEDCCQFLEEHLNMKVTNASLTALPFADNSFDAVCAFDVIEHIKEHDLAVQEIKRVLRPNGRLFLTVPAFNFLWGEHDEINHHERRYTRKMLVDVVADTGIKIERRSYFNFFLFFPIFFVRMLLKLRPKKAAGEHKSDFETFKAEGIINKILYRLFKLEDGILNMKWNFPVGVSVFVIGVKE